MESVVVGRRSATKVMRAAVLAAPGSATVEVLPLPEPGPGEVRVRLEGSGVCASNLAVWEGAPWFEYPLPAGAPGHEGWGTVDAAGPGVSGPAVGDRVTGLFGHAFAEYDITPADHLVPLPAAVDGQPFPGEPVGCAFNILRRAAIEPGETVGIVGIGFLGALLTDLAARAGARVIAISRREWSLRLARERGAAEAVLMDDHQRVVGRVAEITGGKLCARVIECTGKQWPLDLAAAITGERGTLVIAGYHQDGPRQVDMQLWNWRGLDVVNAHERDPAMYVMGIREAVAAVAAGELEIASLFTHRLPFSGLGDALDLTRARPDGFVKALVTT